MDCIYITLLSKALHNVPLIPPFTHLLNHWWRRTTGLTIGSNRASVICPVGWWETIQGSCISYCTSDSFWFPRSVPEPDVTLWDYMVLCRYTGIKNSNLNLRNRISFCSMMEAEKQDAVCITWCFYFLSSCRDAAITVENHQRATATRACEGGGLSSPPGPIAPFQNFEHLKPNYFHK